MAFEGLNYGMPACRKVLKCIERNPGLTASQVMSRTNVSRSTVTSLIVMLLEDRKAYVSGWITPPGVKQSVRQITMGAGVDVPKPVKKSYVHKTFRERSPEEPRFVPHPDPAAAWLFNPV